MIDLIACVSAWRGEEMYSLKIAIRNDEKIPNIWIGDANGDNELLSIDEVFTMIDLFLDYKYKNEDGLREKLKLILNAKI